MKPAKFFETESFYLGDQHGYQAVDSLSVRSADALSSSRASASVSSLVFEPGDGTITGSEIDTYALDLVEGQTYIFSSRGVGGNALVDTQLYMIDDSLTEAGILAQDDDGGDGLNSLITYTATYTGVHYLGVSAYSGSGLTGDYAVDGFPSLGADVVSDDFAQATDLGLSSVTLGFIDAGTSTRYGQDFSEVDTYKFEAEAGKYYTFELAGGADYNSDYTALPAGEIDARLVVYNSALAVVTQNDDISFPDDINAQVGFVAGSSGTYYLDAFSYAPWTGGYSIVAHEYDVVNGTSSNNTLIGGAADDAINGRGGRDLLNGGAGDDLLTGGAGRDTFAFSDLGGSDEILDFVRGTDKVDVSALGDFSWVGSGAFSGGGGAELRGYQWNGDFYLSGDADGNGVGDFLIEVNTALNSHDIILG
jgi:Ca2+-binding RTX toxin-like protein